MMAPLVIGVIGDMVIVDTVVVKNMLDMKTMADDAGKGSQRRSCLISREEETLRWQLVQGEITYREFYKALCKLDPDKVKTLGACGRCVDGLLTGENYSVVCRLDSSNHHQYDLCEKFREDA